MKFSFLKIIFLTLIFGLASGAVGALLVEAYLLPPTTFLTPFQKWNEKKKPLVSEDTEASLAVSRALPAVVDIHLTKQKKSKEILDQIYLPSEVLGKGIILTSDGWILTTNEVINDFKNKYLITVSNKKNYEVKELILDKFSGAVFLKVEAENLPVAEMGSKEELVLGQNVIVLEDNLSFTKIASLNFEPAAIKEDLIKSTEKISKFILIEGVYSLSAPLVDFKGRIIGFTVPLGSLAEKDFTVTLSISDIKSALVDVLKYKEIRRPFLGVNYIDLASVYPLKEEIGYGQKRGALLYENKDLKIKAILPKSPAAVSLRPGDIIVKVDKEELSSVRDLTNIIQEYKAGSLIDLLVLREGKEQTITVKLE